jgi:hypothetical protein
LIGQSSDAEERKVVEHEEDGKKLWKALRLVAAATNDRENHSAIVAT